MKRTYKPIYILLSLCMLFAFCACGTKQDTPIIRASELSKETQELIQPLENDTKFFDFTTDASVTHAVIAIRYCENGTWQETEPLMELSDLEPGTYQMILRWIDSRVDVIVSADGVSWSNPYTIEPEQWDAYRASVITSTVGFGPEQSIVTGSDIPLWCVYGSNTEEISSQSLDYTNSDCDTGFAITATFS
ncbi:MAG: hypothetical protein Q4D42_03615 [Eubacteriales bacterium]|nr:hypothetical protein [Eubacteriales bacterium]